MLRLIPRRLAIWVALLCLAMTVVALGAAAKHSQFDSVGHSTSYLAQSVKMVAGNHAESVAVMSAVVAPKPLVKVAPVLMHIPVMPVLSAAPSLTPLIV